MDKEVSFSSEVRRTIGGGKEKRGYTLIAESQGTSHFPEPWVAQSSHKAAFCNIYL